MMLVTSLFACATVHAFPISSLDTGAGLYGDGGAVDSNWTVSSIGATPPYPVTGSTYVVPMTAVYPGTGASGSLFNDWTHDTTTSSWITYSVPAEDQPDDTGDTLQYQLKFTVTTAGSIDIDYASDNESTFYLYDGSDLVLDGSLGSQAFGSLTPFDLASADVGKYTLDVDVTNDPNGSEINPSGVDVQLGGTVGVPDGGATVALLGISLAAVAVIRRRMAVRNCNGRLK
jgi:hypothetical protein